MATTLQLRRGTTAEANALTGAAGELFVDLTTKTMRLHDGTTAGGFASQPQLVSGTNIKTVNGQSVLGSGDLVISGGSGGQAAASGAQVFTSNGVFTVPPNVSLIKVTVVGGGGGGEGAISYGAGDGGDIRYLWTGNGGGSGGVAIRYLSVNPGDSYPVTVGAGGLGGTGNYPNPQSGGDGGTGTGEGSGTGTGDGGGTGTGEEGGGSPNEGGGGSSTPPTPPPQTPNTNPQYGGNSNVTGSGLTQAIFSDGGFPGIDSLIQVSSPPDARGGTINIDGSRPNIKLVAIQSAAGASTAFGNGGAAIPLFFFSKRAGFSAVGHGAGGGGAVNGQDSSPVSGGNGAPGVVIFEW
jgi:hypothetical protein